MSWTLGEHFWLPDWLNACRNRARPLGSSFSKWCPCPRTYIHQRGAAGSRRLRDLHTRARRPHHRAHQSSHLRGVAHGHPRRAAGKAVVVLLLIRVVERVDTTPIKVVSYAWRPGKTHSRLPSTYVNNPATRAQQRKATKKLGRQHKNAGVKAATALLASGAAGPAAV